MHFGRVASHCCKILRTFADLLQSALSIYKQELLNTNQPGAKVEWKPYLIGLQSGPSVDAA